MEYCLIAITDIPATFWANQEAGEVERIWKHGMGGGKVKVPETKMPLNSFRRWSQEQHGLAGKRLRMLTAGDGIWWGVNIGCYLLETEDMEIRELGIPRCLDKKLVWVLDMEEPDVKVRLPAQFQIMLRDLRRKWKVEDGDVKNKAALHCSAKYRTLPLRDLFSKLPPAVENPSCSSEDEHCGARPAVESLLSGSPRPKRRSVALSSSSQRPYPEPTFPDKFNYGKLRVPASPLPSPAKVKVVKEELDTEPLSLEKELEKVMDEPVEKPRQTCKVGNLVFQCKVASNGGTIVSDSSDPDDMENEDGFGPPPMVRG